ncbi:MAG: hypothetical protein Q8W45_05075 [Candidatus Palauibacterales bacterium]|nr:hypothetical protein [Candidatus Palauibacterales bacterium]
MRRIAKMSLALCIAAALASCDASNATGLEDPDSSADVQSPTTAAPLAARLNGPRVVKGQLEGSDEYGDLCGGGEGIEITSTGYGTVSHFGNTVMVSTICVDLGDFSVIGSAPFSLKGANGDEAGGFLTGVDYTSYGFDLLTTITWGTGRFEGATGELVFPTVSTGTGVWTSGVEGWLTY